MSLLNEARFDFGLVLMRMYAINPDFTLPKPTRVVGGIGPFDMSGASDIAAVPIKFKTDNAAAVEEDVDLSGAANQAAVTVDEVVTAITTASPTGITASKETGTNRLKIALTTPGTAVYLQVWDELAELTGIGQGRGVRFIKSDTMQSSAETILRIDDEQIGIVDAEGRTTEIDTDGYRRGVSFVLTDTAVDYDIKSLVEGGKVVDGEYIVPTINDERVYFYLEIFAKRYREGTSKERNIVGYIQQKVFNCKGTAGDKTRERGWATGVYNVTATTWRDENDAFQEDSREAILSVTDFEALNVKTV